jgi:hypothetical protein
MRLVASNAHSILDFACGEMAGVDAEGRQR